MLLVSSELLTALADVNMKQYELRHVQERDGRSKKQHDASGATFSGHRSLLEFVVTVLEMSLKRFLLMS